MIDDDFEPVRKGDVVLIPVRISEVDHGAPLLVRTLDGTESLLVERHEVHGFQRRVFAVGDQVYDADRMSDDREAYGEVVLVSADYVLVKFRGQVLPIVYPVDGNEVLTRITLSKKSAAA